MYIILIVYVCPKKRERKNADDDSDAGPFILRPTDMISMSIRARHVIYLTIQHQNTRITHGLCSNIYVTIASIDI